MARKEGSDQIGGIPFGQMSDRGVVVKTGSTFATVLQDQYAVSIITTSLTLSTESRVFADATSGAIIITLPPSVSWTGKTYVVKKIDSSSNTVTIDANGAELIDGVLTKVLTVSDPVVTISSDGTGWRAIGGGSGGGGSGSEFDSVDPLDYSAAVIENGAIVSSVVTTSDSDGFLSSTVTSIAAGEGRVFIPISASEWIPTANQLLQSVCTIVTGGTATRVGIAYRFQGFATGTYIVDWDPITTGSVSLRRGSGVGVYSTLATYPGSIPSLGAGSAIRLKNIIGGGTASVLAFGESIVTDAVRETGAAITIAGQWGLYLETLGVGTGVFKFQRVVGLPATTLSLTGASASGTAGGDLTGTYPNPNVNKIQTTGTSVTVGSAAPPSTGQVLTATGATTATWQTPSGGSPTGAAGGDLSGTYPNPKVTKLETTGTSVTIGTAAPPTTGQVLTATGATAATWQTTLTGSGVADRVTLWSGTSTVTSSGSLTFTGGDLLTVSAKAVISPAAVGTGSPVTLTVTQPAHTGLTAGTENTSVFINCSATKTFATGAITTQREVVVSAPTYAFSGASVVTNASSFTVTGAPVAGTNATITNSYAIWVQNGTSRFEKQIIQGTRNVDNADFDLALGLNRTLTGSWGSLGFVEIEPVVTVSSTGTNVTGLTLAPTIHVNAPVSLVFGSVITPSVDGTGSISDLIGAYVGSFYSGSGTITGENRSLHVAGGISSGSTPFFRGIKVDPSVDTTGSVTSEFDGILTIPVHSSSGVTIPLCQSIIGRMDITNGAIATTARGATFGVSVDGASSSAVTAHSLYINAPVATGGGTITNAYACILEAPTVGTSVNLSLYSTGDSQFNSRVLNKRNSDVASATTITVSGGNYARITGTTTITNLTTTGWTEGSIVVLKFTAALTFTHGNGSSGGLRLSGSTNLTTAADTRITLVLDGGFWWETSRTLA